MEADFSGYVTKAGIVCSDGRTILPGAFKHQDGETVPLVWEHGRGGPDNILGHVILEHRADGVYGYGFFNDTESGKSSKTLVAHKDVTNLSIYANRLVEKAKKVADGVIREVSLVLSGANPGALIDNVKLAHSDDDIEILYDEAVIYSGVSIEHGNSDGSDDPKDSVEHASDSATLEDVYNTLDDDQKELVHYMIGAALEEASASHSDDENETNNNTGDEGDLEHKEGTEMPGIKRNVFEQQKKGDGADEAYALTHSDLESIFADAETKGSLKAAVEDFALAHGIDNIEILFPDATAISSTPEFDKRRTEWVSTVLNGTRHTPFSRIKTFSADITMEEARAKGYIKGKMKKEEFFSVSKRETTPKTIYKKQKLDRDDIIDITDFDIVAWMKGEMRLMLDEELARAALIGDGREVDDEDKIDETKIRPIAKDHDLYTTQVYVNVDDANSSYLEVIDAIISARRFYKGSGTPTFFTTEIHLTKMLLLRDEMNRRLYRNVQELADELRVSSIVTVEVMEEVDDLIGIVVNLQDYAIGADRGGEVTLFEDFDIDYNQQKYLLETRVSGALTKIKSALAIRKTAGANVLTVPAAPEFDKGIGAGGELTFPNDTHVVYKIGNTVYDNTDNPVPVAAGTTVTVDATPAAGFYFANSAEDSWSFTAE